MMLGGILMELLPDGPDDGVPEMASAVSGVISPVIDAPAYRMTNGELHRPMAWIL